MFTTNGDLQVDNVDNFDKVDNVEKVNKVDMPYSHVILGMELFSSSLKALANVQRVFNSESSIEG